MEFSGTDSFQRGWISTILRHKKLPLDFLDGPVVKILHFWCRGLGLDNPSCHMVYPFCPLPQKTKKLLEFEHIAIYDKCFSIYKKENNSSIIVIFKEKEMATYSSTLAWRIPWMEEPGRLQSMGFHGARQDWASSIWLSSFIHWRRKWQPTPLFLPGESQGQQSLLGCLLWGRTEWDTTERT